jgi:hypothetical protein
MHRWALLVAATATLLATGCTAVPQQHVVKKIHICAGEDCDTADLKYTIGQVLAGLQQLLTANEGQKVTICKSEPTTRACKSVGICQFVLGGILPGNGCAQSIVFSDIAAVNQTSQINLKANMPLTFVGSPVLCNTTTGTLSVRSLDEIAIELQPRYCNWMVVGNMTATFNFAVESLDLSHGQIGGYWSHAVAGTGNGRGSGYAVLKFPSTSPAGGNPLVRQP